MFSSPQKYSAISTMIINDTSHYAVLSLTNQWMEMTLRMKCAKKLFKISDIKRPIVLKRRMPDGQGEVVSKEDSKK